MGFGKVVPVPGQKGDVRAAAAPGRWGARDGDCARTGGGGITCPQHNVLVWALFEIFIFVTGRPGVIGKVGYRQLYGLRLRHILWEGWLWCGS